MTMDARVRKRVEILVFAEVNERLKRRGESAKLKIKGSFLFRNLIP